MGPGLKAEEIERFDERGYVHLERVLTEDEVGALSAAVDALRSNPSKHGAELGRRRGDETEERESAEPAFFLDRYLYRTHPEFGGFVAGFGKRLAALAGEAMCSEQVRLYFDQVFVKDPGTDEQFSWHQDRPFWAVDGNQVASTWVALTESDAEGSALEFVAGSHRWGVDLRPDFPGLRGADPAEAEARLWPGVADHLGNFDVSAIDYENEPDTYRVESFAVSPGDVLLFDYRVVHRSRGNSSDRIRKAVSWRWLGDDAIWAPKVGSDPIVSQDDTVLRPGDRITDDKAFPLIFGER